MALLQMFGFNHCNQNVGPDGVSPVEGVGLTDSGFAALTRSATPLAYCPVGVVSDTRQAMGAGALKRQPLVFRQNFVNGSATGNTNGHMTATTKVTFLGANSTGGLTRVVGFRFVWDYDGSAATVAAGTFAIFAETFHIVGNGTPQPQNLIWLDPVNQQLVFGTSATTGTKVALAAKQETYLELRVLDANAVVFMDGNQVATITRGNANIDFSFGFIAGGFTTPTASPTSFGALKFTDFYILDATGSAPWNNILGPIKVLPVMPDTIISNTMAPSPTNLTATQVIATRNDNETLNSGQTSTASNFNISALPGGVDGQLLAIQAFIVASRDPGYSQTLKLTEATGGTSATPATVTMPGTAAVTAYGPIRTTLVDGSTLSPSTIANYQIGATSA